MVWLSKAHIEAPHRREIWLDLAEELHGQADWPNLFWACANGIEKTRRTGSYLDDANCWGFRLYDLGAIAACGPHRHRSYCHASLRIRPRREGTSNRQKALHGLARGALIPSVGLRSDRVLGAG
jgi:hypothetical protein